MALRAFAFDLNPAMVIVAKARAVDRKMASSSQGLLLGAGGVKSTAPPGFSPSGRYTIRMPIGKSVLYGDHTILGPLVLTFAALSMPPSLLMDIVLIAMEPLKGSVLCRVPGCGHKASVQINHYFGLDDSRSWDARSSGPVCKTHLSKLQEHWAACDVRQAF